MATALKWTNSSLLTLRACGERYRRRYIEREFFPPSPRMVRGTAVHRAVRYSMMNKLERQALPSVEAVADVAASEFESAWAQGVRAEPDEDLTVQRGPAKDMAINLSRLHRTAVAPQIEPVSVERRITVRPKDSDLVIEGTVDLIALAGGGHRIHDTKTAEKSPPSGAADTSQQITMYNLIDLAETGHLPGDSRLDYLVQTPATKQLKHVPLTTTRSMEHMQAMVSVLTVATQAVQRGVFLPAPADWWGCSAEWCEYFQTCPYTRGRHRPED